MDNILICDDDRDIVAALKIYLTNSNYRLFEAYDGRQAVEIVRNEEIHLVLMDIMMPEMDGIEAMTAIRKFSNVPIILLTAKSEDTDIILGLTIGADDYITKPFNPLEVTARAASCLRRYRHLGGSQSEDGAVVIGGLELFDAEKKVLMDGRDVMLTPTEYDILHLLMLKPGKVFSPEEIYREVWKESSMGTEGTVAVHIRHLREKIEIDPSNPRYLKVVWGQGYKIEGKR